MDVEKEESKVTAVSLLKLGRAEHLVVSSEEMQRLYFDGRAIRRYCLQCRGPKFMIPSKKSATFHDNMADTSTPEKYSIVCKACGTKYTAKLNVE